MSDLKINNITDRTGGSGPVIAGVSTVSTTGAFVVPVGPTEMRGGRGRGVFGGGNTLPAMSNSIEYITIAGVPTFEAKVVIKELSKNHEVWIVAPKNNCSGMSAAISYLNEIEVIKLEDKIYAVDGTPADCSYLGLLN